MQTESKRTDRKVLSAVGFPSLLSECSSTLCLVTCGYAFFSFSLLHPVIVLQILPPRFFFALTIGFSLRTPAFCANDSSLYRCLINANIRHRTKISFGPSWHHTCFPPFRCKCNETTRNVPQIPYVLFIITPHSKLDVKVTLFFISNEWDLHQGSWDSHEAFSDTLGSATPLFVYLVKHRIIWGSGS